MMIIYGYKKHQLHRYLWHQSDLPGNIICLNKNSPAKNQLVSDQITANQACWTDIALASISLLIASRGNLSPKMRCYFLRRKLPIMVADLFSRWQTQCKAILTANNVTFLDSVDLNSGEHNKMIKYELWGHKCKEQWHCFITPSEIEKLE
jgi:hypothetical protein